MIIFLEIKIILVIKQIILRFVFKLFIYFFKNKLIIIIGDWGLGIGDWGLGIGDWAQSPIPNPQSPIPMLLFFLF